jgi:hypothetical protein
MERDELKRAVVSIFRNRPFNFNLLEYNPDPVVNFDLRREQSPEILFLEQAFEWEHLGAIFYPYFWGQQQQKSWETRITATGGDAMFREFLRAGAARVRVSVRPGFESAVQYYMMTGKPWNGGPMPKVGEKMYVSFIEEQLEGLGAPNPDEKPYPPPPDEPLTWEIVQPTSLIRLRVDNTLPRWEPLGLAPGADPLKGWDSTTGEVEETS